MKEVMVFLLIAAMLLGLCACVPGDTTTGTAGPAGSTGTTGVTTAPPRYEIDPARNEAIVNDGGQVTKPNAGNARVYYQIFVGSFADSNGDGVGDLRGIIERFDYLNDGKDNSGLSLGVEGIWLSPIFISPSYHKYDVSDYYQVDPKFGTEEDLKELIDLCHSRNVQIILDMVINHTSSRHYWFELFQNAHKAGDTESMYYDYYVYSDSKSNGSRTFSAIQGTSEYYECNFSTEMPELNFDNENVRQEMVDAAAYYLDLGVDGFRFDAAKYIYYGDDVASAAFWDWYMAQLRAIKPDIYTVAEVWSGDGATYPYFSSTNCFNFSMAQSSGMIAQTAKEGDVNRFTEYVRSYLEQIRGKNENAMIAPFIANHDTDRAAGFLTVSSGQAYVAANLNLLMPGSPFIYYGEEIGMKGSRGGANTDANRRLAMLWGDGDTVKDPTGTTYKPSNQNNGTVASQKPDGASLYNHYKKLIQIRKANPEIAYGQYQPLVLEGKAGGFVSTYEGVSVAVLHNTTLEAVQIDLSKLPELAAMQIAAFAGKGEATLEGSILTIQPQTSVVLR